MVSTQRLTSLVLPFVWLGSPENQRLDCLLLNTLTVLRANQAAGAASPPSAILARKQMEDARRGTHTSGDQAMC